MAMAGPHLHQTHAEIVKRLKRAAGHLRTVIGMIEQGRECVDLAQQLHAVEKAIDKAKKTLIHDHIDHCLEHSTEKRGQNAREAIREFKQITKYL
jgi:DNA-binding FrmR family transcriptional regulator